MKNEFAASGFSLVEVVLALGIVVFCLIALLGLIPAGLQSIRESSEEVAAQSLLQQLASDLRQTPFSTNVSPRFEIPIPAAGSPGIVQTNYFSETLSWAPTADARSRYRISLRVLPPTNGDSRAATVIHLMASWPVQADPSNASGRVELLTAVDRN